MTVQRWWRRREENQVDSHHSVFESISGLIEAKGASGHTRGFSVSSIATKTEDGKRKTLSKSSISHRKLNDRVQRRGSKQSWQERSQSHKQKCNRTRSGDQTRVKTYTPTISVCAMAPKWKEKRTQHEETTAFSAFFYFTTKRSWVVQRKKTKIDRQIESKSSSIKWFCHFAQSTSRAAHIWERHASLFQSPKKDQGFGRDRRETKDRPKVLQKSQHTCKMCSSRHHHL